MTGHEKKVVAKTGKSVETRSQRGARLGTDYARVNAELLTHLRYFADLKPLHQLLSLTTFKETRNEQKQRGSQRGSANSLMAFGDPDYSQYTREPRFQRLENSRSEVVTLVKQSGASAHCYLGADASEALAKQVCGQASILHFACHGLLDNADPLASGLALTPGGGEDGLLQAWEIFEQVRLKADLVVLSACETRSCDRTQSIAIPTTGRPSSSSGTGDRQEKIF